MCNIVYQKEMVSARCVFFVFYQSAKIGKNRNKEK